MDLELAILIGEAVSVYCLVLGAHALRHRWGLAHYYALVGGVTAIMSWVTDAGVAVHYSGITFVVGSTVFYTALLLSVFVVYVFDGPRATRIAISTIIGVSVLVPLIALTLDLQLHLTGNAPMVYVPTPSLRLNSASVFATFMDLIFLAIAWEYMNNRLQWLHLGLRAFLTLLGVMWLDVLLFATGAFAGTGNWLSIMQGTALSRLLVSIFAAPILWGYLYWQNRIYHTEMEQRPVLAIIKEFAEIKRELTMAQQEIERRKRAEWKLKQVQEKLRRQATTDPLTGLGNRRQFFKEAGREIKRARRYGQPLSLVAIDLDHFKLVNDRHGHQAGDQVLVQVARAGRDTVRDTDLLARLGGEEFAVLLPETSLNQALVMAERLRQALAGVSVQDRNRKTSITASLGVAQLGDDTATVDDLLNAADRRLYRAKELGRNRVEAGD